MQPAHDDTVQGGKLREASHLEEGYIKADCHSIKGIQWYKKSCAQLTQC